MEDSGQGFRRTRAESSSSRDTRMTPSSSTNSSSAHLPRSSAGARAGPGASLLQERLRERKVESARQSRRMSVDLGAGQRDVQSSPVKPIMAREEKRPSSSGVLVSKGMGVKQIEEQVSTLHKQNFDLKLELYHRRQRQEALEARVESVEKEIAEQQEVNEQLLAELEKRDQAVEEAVGIIVTLEDKVERLEQDREAVRTFDAEYESGYFRESHDLSSSPPTSNEKLARPKLDAKAVARMPSFLSEQSEGAEALRSLYLPHKHSYSDATLPKLVEEAGADVPDSPRLSFLSESSFLSVYGEKRGSPGSDEVEEVDLPQRIHRKSASVEKWIDDRPARNENPIKRTDGIRKNGYLSLNDVLESPLQKLEKLRHTLEKHNTSLVSTRLPIASQSFKEDERLRPEDKRKARELLRRGLTNNPSLEYYQALPPTPDTISTSTLTHHQHSNDTLSKQAAANGQTFPSNTSTFSVPQPPYNSYQSTHSLRPRSAGETVTSRREGHGWDTPQEDLTETGSLSSTASASAYAANPQRNGIIPPNLFTFNDIDNRDEMSSWGRDMMFNNDQHLPSQTARHYTQLRRSSMVDHARSDETVVSNNRLSQYNGEQSQNVYGVSPIDTSPRPHLPDRRSSLSATAKLRKVNPLGTSASSPISKDKPTELKKSRLAMMPRIFTRSDTTPPVNSFPQRPRGNGGRSLSHFDGAPQSPHYEEVDMARATPPPIKRNRGPAVPTYRPSSADEDAARARKGSTFEYDGVGEEAYIKRRSVDLSAADNKETEDPTAGAKNGGGQRKWLGFGRTGSLRRP